MAMDSPLASIGDIKTDRTWISLNATVVKLWDNKHSSISQAGLIADETGIIKFIVFKKSNLPIIEEGHDYVFKNLVTKLWNNRLQVMANRLSIIKARDEEGINEIQKKRRIEDLLKQYNDLYGIDEDAYDARDPRFDHYNLYDSDENPIRDLGDYCYHNYKYSEGEEPDDFENI